MNFSRFPRRVTLSVKLGLAYLPFFHDLSFPGVDSKFWGGLARGGWAADGGPGRGKDLVVLQLLKMLRRRFWPLVSTCRLQSTFALIADSQCRNCRDL